MCRSHKLQPFALWRLFSRSKNFDLVTTIEFVIERYEFVIDLGGNAPVAHIGVEHKGKIQCCSIFCDGFYFAFGSKYKNFGSKKI